MHDPISPFAPIRRGHYHVFMKCTPVFRTLYGVLFGAMLLSWPRPTLAQHTQQPGSIVLLGAHWCAPCMKELRDLPELARMVAPRAIVLAWVDRGVPVPPALSRQVSVWPVEQAQALALRLGGQGFGLPMATVIDGKGQPCPVWRKPLRAETLAAFLDACP
jgi:thiol-disulfide isomerase/thioredoxin